MEHGGRKSKTPGYPLKMSGMEERFEAPSPLGAHTEGLLSGLLGYDSLKIETLREKGVVAP